MNELESGVSRSRTGKLPRSTTSELRERRDTSYRSRMQDARQHLASELGAVSEVQSLLKLRLARGYSQQQLASVVGTSQSHIAKMEAGTVRVYLETADRVAKALGVSIDELNQALAVSPRVGTPSTNSGPTAA